MASRIAGITIEISGNTTKLVDSLKDVDKQIRTTNTSLRDVNKLLKLDPKNTELLTQKQKLLKEAIGLTKDRLAELKAAQSQFAEGSAEWDALEREIIDTEGKLKGLEKQYSSFGSVLSQQMQAVGRAVSDAGEKVSALGEKLAPVSGAAAALGGSLVKLGYDAVTNADDLNTLAKQTGLSTAEIQKMKYASDLIDVSFDDISGALRKMKGNMDKQPDAWEALGVATTNADGSMRDATDVFYDTIEALSKVENGTERDKLAMDIFGKSADSLAGIVDDGGAALKEFGTQAEETGLILSQDTLDALNETNDTIDEMKATIGGTLAQIGADIATILAPALEKVAEVVSTVTEALRNLSPEQEALILKIIGITAVVAPLLIIIGKVISFVGLIITSVGSIIGVLGPVIAMLGGPLTIAIGAAIAAGALIIANWDKIVATAKGMKDAVVNAWNQLKAELSAAVSNIKADVSAKWEAIKTSVTTIVNNVKTTVKSTFDTIKSNVVSVVDSLKSSVTTKFNALKTAMTNPIETAKKTITDAVNKIKNVVNNAKLSLPHFKLPHFKINGGVLPWGIGGQGVKPSISVSWYKKAYDNPVMFTSPTVLPTMAGMKGFGDGAGAEIVMSLNKLREMVGTGGVTNNIVVNAAPGMDVMELADAVADAIEFRTQQARAVYA